MTEQCNQLSALSSQHNTHKHPHHRQQRRSSSPFDRQPALQSPTASSSSAAAGDHGDSIHDDEVDTGRQHQQQLCAGCRRPISERYLLRAIERYWHEDCLKCSCCDCRLGEVGSTLYTKADLMLCRRDYLRLFGATGLCSVCTKIIPAFELVMKARGNVYHLECFACQECSHRFCIGDRYYLCDNKILCQFDYDQQIVLAKLAHGHDDKRSAPDVKPSISLNGAAVVSTSCCSMSRVSDRQSAKTW